MTLAGLSFGAFAGLFAGLAALTTLLYVLKLRRRPVAVPFSPIWQRVLRDKEASRLYSRLRHLLSLLLQLVLVGLLALSASDPKSGQIKSSGRSIVVLVDTSASMQATDVLPQRIDVARTEVKKLVSGLSGADRMLVAKMDAATVPLSTMTADAAELSAALESLATTDTRADLRRGLSFASDALYGAPHPEVIVVSDGGVDAAEATRGLSLGALPIRFVPVGLRGKNVAISGLSVRRYPLDASRYEVLLDVTNTNAVATSVELTLVGDGSVIDVSRLALGPNERLSRVYGDLTGASRTLEARIRLADGTRDDLPTDDRAYALMPERRRVRVHVVTRGNTYLEAALLLDEYLDVTTVDPSAYSPAGAFDVTLFDGVAPGLPDHGGAFFLNPPAEGSPVKLGKAIADFGFDTWDRKSPLLRWMALDNVQVAKGHVLLPDPADRVVGASELGPTLVAGKRGETPFVLLGFDPRDSDWVLRTAFPLFVLNVIRSFGEDDASYLSSFRTGEAWHIPVGSDVSVARVRDPRGRTREVAVREGRAVFFGDLAGFYQLTAQNGAAPILFAGNLGDFRESQIEPERSLTLSGKTLPRPDGFSSGVRSEFWGLLLLAAVLLSTIEWVTYHRRITV